MRAASLALAAGLFYFALGAAAARSLTHDAVERSQGQEVVAARPLDAVEDAAARAIAADESAPPAWWDAPLATTKPIIGVLAQRCHNCPGRSYVAAGFVKWLEAAGARVVPIRYYSSDAELRRLFDSVNGLVFPGGLTDLYLDSPYVVAARKLWRWAREANDAGRAFPIHGTCLGFQLLHILEVEAHFEDLLVDTDSVAHASTLEWAPGAARSWMFSGMDADLVDKLADPAFNISLENHQFGLPPAHYDKWPALRDAFKVLNTARDRAGVEYVATAEHRAYPFFATQWHPEKPPFEFGMAEVPHTLDAIRVSQRLANAFVEAARRSPHAFASPEQELEESILNYKAWFTLKDSVMDPSYDGPDVTYFFDEPDEPPSGPDDRPDAPPRRAEAGGDFRGAAHLLGEPRARAGATGEGAAPRQGLHAGAY